MQHCEGVAQQCVSSAARHVQILARGLVVAKVGEPSSLRIEGIGPIRIRTARIKGHEPPPRPGAARVPESSLVADREQRSERVVSYVASAPATIGGVDEEIRAANVLEGDLVRLSIPPGGSHCVSVAVGKDLPGTPTSV